MLDLNLDPDDDPEFVERIAPLIAGAAAVYELYDVRVFKVDNWFDHKWLGFSGKVLGAVGLWWKPLTVPPFVANRLVRRWRFVLEDGAYRPVGDGPEIHHVGWSSENLHRPASRIAPGSALFWFSGQTQPNGRGSLMGYLPIDVEEQAWPWYVSFRREPGAGWSIHRRKSIHAYEIRRFAEVNAGINRL